MKAIETSYNGYRFRSRLEARTAVFMDEARIRYIYEPEGFVFDDGTTYLPDFYLPDNDVFLECKGVMSGKDEHKIEMLAKESGKRIVIMNPDMLFDISFWVDNLGEYLPNHDNSGGIYPGACALVECAVCQRRFFTEPNYPISCPHCGATDKMQHTLCNGYEFNSYSFEPMRKARTARFEFGEVGKQHAEQDH